MVLIYYFLEIENLTILKKKEEKFNFEIMWLNINFRNKKEKKKIYIIHIIKIFKLSYKFINNIALKKEMRCYAIY